jgi:hypothetical protein
MRKMEEHLRRKPKKMAKRSMTKEANVLLYTSDLILVPTSCESSRLYLVGVFIVHLVSISIFSM